MTKLVCFWVCVACLFAGLLVSILAVWGTIGGATIWQAIATLVLIAGTYCAYDGIQRYFFPSALAILLTLSGCWSSPSPGPGPKPQPAPQPPGSAVNVVVMLDPAGETPGQAAIYCDEAARSYLRKSGHEFRLVSAAEKNPPAYLKAYCDAGRGQKLPAVITGRGGKVLSTAPLPASSQAFIDLVEKSLGTAGEGDVPSLWAGGDRRSLGCLPLRPGAGQRWRTEGSQPNEPLVPRAAWTDVSFAYLAPPVLDQDGYSCCAACATVQSLATAERRFGFEPAQLSVVDCYARGNGGRDRGMVLEDALAIACQGVCTTEFANLWGVSKTAHKTGYEADRKRHAVLSAAWCPTADYVGSAIQRRRPVVFGTMVGDSFKPDSAGVIGPPRGGDRGGHAMYLVGMHRINGAWHFQVVNSWGTKWGLSGTAWIHEAWINPSFGAWSISAVVSDPSDPLPASKESTRIAGIEGGNSPPQFYLPTRDAIFLAL